LHRIKSRLYRGLSIVVLLISLTIPATVYGQSDEPPQPSDPITPTELDPNQTQTESPDMATSDALGLPPLKAVLIVGPVDADPAWVQRESTTMDLVANELAAKGVSVSKFYYPNTSWTQIKTAAQGAHFLIYRGDGVLWPGNVYGGFYLKDGLKNHYSSDDIRNELRLAKGAIVMLYACWSAGSAGWEVNLASAEAQKRVTQYSDPFFDIGAAGYYANWYPEGFQMFVRYLFQGNTLGQAYQSFFDYNTNTVERYSHSTQPGMVLWLDSDNINGGIKYDNAFAGNSNASLQSLFLTSLSMPNKIFVPLVRR